MGKASSKGSNQRVLSVFVLAMINVAAIVSLRTFPQMAFYGLASVFFYVIAGFLFFIPVALVSAELATGWPQTGGVYVWVKEALGQRWGFLAIWLQWIENVIWFPTVLSFAAATLIFPFYPALAQNRFYTLAVVLGIFWGATLINFRGMRISGLISTIGVIFGTLLAGVLIIGLAVVYLLQGDKSRIPLTISNLYPDMTNIRNVVFAAGVILGLAGMEMSAVHAQEVKNPQRDYPKAILLSVVVILSVSILGSLAIAIVVPGNQISLVAGLMQAFSSFLDQFNLRWMVPIIAFLVAAGTIGQVSTWIVGPSKGLFATAQDGSLPTYFQNMNKNRMPTHMLIVQAIILTAISGVILLMPTVNSSYWILTALTSQLYLIMYILMFVSAIKLRYTRADTPRAYKIPGGRAGMWVVAGIGGLTSLATIIIGFFPPSQLQTGNLFFYEAFLVLGITGMCLTPVVIHHFRKDSWKPSQEEQNKAA